MSRRGQLPELLFVAPVGAGRVKIRHRHVAMRVLSKRDGVPLMLQLMRDDEVVDIQGGEEFVTAYLQERVLREGECSGGREGEGDQG